jgi:hypothetical protein
MSSFLNCNEEISYQSQEYMVLQEIASADVKPDLRRRMKDSSRQSKDHMLPCEHAQTQGVFGFRTFDEETSTCRSSPGSMLSMGDYFTDDKPRPWRMKENVPIAFMSSWVFVCVNTLAGENIIS